MNLLLLVSLLSTQVPSEKDAVRAALVTLHSARSSESLVANIALKRGSGIDPCGTQKAITTYGTFTNDTLVFTPNALPDGGKLCLELLTWSPKGGKWSCSVTDNLRKWSFSFVSSSSIAGTRTQIPLQKADLLSQFGEREVSVSCVSQPLPG